MKYWHEDGRSARRHCDPKNIRVRVRSVVWILTTYTSGASMKRTKKEDGISLKMDMRVSVGTVFMLRRNTDRGASANPGNIQREGAGRGEQRTRRTECRE